MSLPCVIVTTVTMPDHTSEYQVEVMPPTKEGLTGTPKADYELAYMAYYTVNGRFACGKPLSAMLSCLDSHGFGE